MTTQITSENSPNNFPFEDLMHKNGMLYAWASEYMKFLGYEDLKSFSRAIERATQALISLTIEHRKQIVLTPRLDANGNSYDDYKLTRFACYMIAMNGDVKRPEVARAQVYFAEQARQMEMIIKGSQDIERLIVRDDIKKGNISLNAAAAKAGVNNYARFNNAGYLGMYNMTSWNLEKYKGLPIEERNKLLDHMGRTEMAANLFRITQTEERLKSDKVTNQMDAENTHSRVASAIRELVRSNTGKNPEDLPLENKLPDVKKQLKAGLKKMTKLDQQKLLE